MYEKRTPFSPAKQSSKAIRIQEPNKRDVITEKMMSLLEEGDECSMQYGAIIA